MNEQNIDTFGINGRLNGGDKILRLPAILEYIGVSQSTLYSWMAQGLFPRPIKLGPRAIGWHVSTILEWQQHREENS